MLPETLIVVFLSSLFFVVQSVKLPSFITPCRRNDPNMSKCFATQVENLRPYLPKGIPSLGIPPCDPMVIPSIHLEQPSSGSVGFKASLSNLSFFEALDFEVKKVFVKVEDEGFFHIVINFPKMKMDSMYKAAGKVLIVNFEGEGSCHGVFTNVTASGKWWAKPADRNGEKYMKIYKDEGDVTVGGIFIEFDDLFKGNPEVTAATNKLINENSELLFLEIKPIITAGILNVINSVVNFVTNRYPRDVLYPL